MNISASLARKSVLSIGLAVMLLSGVEAAASAGPLPSVRVHTGGHYLETSEGRPFFWLGDTAWNLVHRTSRDETTYYLQTRARQGYTVIQTVALAEIDGVRTASAFGENPLIDEDPSRPNEAYFNRIVDLVDEANALGLYVALLPAWGDKLTAPLGDGPRLFRLDNLEVARGYARYLAAKLKDRPNVIWMLGGDRHVDLPESRKHLGSHKALVAAGFPEGHDWRPIWREMAAGLEEGMGKKPVIFFHMPGGYSSSVSWPDEPWLAAHGMQSGHGGHDIPVWEWIAKDFARNPAKPTLDLEPNYEDHPINPWPRFVPANGYFRDHDVRKQVYRSVFAGGCGVTYGHHAIWSVSGLRHGVYFHADRDWVDALHRPGGTQMIHLRRLIESRPFFTRIPDQALVSNPSPDRARHVVASRDQEGTYAFAYFPGPSQKVTIDLARLRPGKLRASWYDPRTGFARDLGSIEGGAPREFTSPPDGPDWVLVLDSAEAGYAPPGLKGLIQP